LTTGGWISKRRHVDSFVGPGGKEAVDFINLIIAAVRCS
jgi:hypothetical protein